MPCLLRRDTRIRGPKYRSRGRDVAQKGEAQRRGAIGVREKESWGGEAEPVIVGDRGRSRGDRGEIEGEPVIEGRVVVVRWWTVEPGA
jgi:hypothetical protein